MLGVPPGTRTGGREGVYPSPPFVCGCLPEHCLQGLVESFHQAVSLGVVGARPDGLYTQEVVRLCQQLGRVTVSVSQLHVHAINASYYITCKQFKKKKDIILKQKTQNT